MKQTIIAVITIDDATSTHSRRNIETALNFHWGSNGKFNVKFISNILEIPDKPFVINLLEEKGNGD